MKLFTRSSILKSTAIEIISPILLECEAPSEYLLLSMSKARQATIEKENTAASEKIPNSSEEENIISSKEEWSAEGTNLIAQAKIEADHIIAEAREKAEELLKTAQLQSEDLRKSIENVVREEIIPLARAEGLEQGLEEAEREANLLRKQAKDYLELAQKVRKDEFDRVDQELINLCLHISEKIIHTSLSFDSRKLINIIRNLTLMPREKEGIKIHLSLSDWEWYKELPNEDKPSYPVIVDESLKMGDSFLECAEGIFDARIKSQLEVMEQYLLEGLEHGRLDGVSKAD